MKRLLAFCLALLFLLPSGCAAPAPFGGAEGRGWRVGFGKSCLLPGDVGTHTYYVAGYRPGNRAEGLLDPQFARAVWLDDGTGRGGIVLAAVDCVGLARADVEEVRRSLGDFVRKTGCRGIHIMSTHTHAGIDTLGLWGPLGSSGRDEGFMETVRSGIRQAVLDAYADARQGALTVGSTEVEGLQRDSRNPQIFDETLTRLRFVPEDGSRELYIVHFSAHPEALGSGNSLISADFPCYMGQRITERTGAEFLYFTGAIGGLISTHAQEDEGGEKLPALESTKKTGRVLGDAACDIRQERVLPARLDAATRELLVPLENPVLMLAAFLGVIATRPEPGGGPYQLSIRTELSYIELGGQKLLLIPGELFPELAYGGALETGAAGAGTDNPPTFAELLGGDDFLVLGLANDELGYILPPNDFYLDGRAPYVAEGRDAQGRAHYEETNSTGPQAAACVTEALRRLLAELRY